MGLSEKLSFNDMKKNWVLSGDYKIDIRSSVDGVSFPHYHDFAEIFLLVSGSMVFTTLENSSILRAGALVYSKEGEVHSKSASEPIRLLHIAFPTKLLRTLRQYLGEDIDIEMLHSSAETPCVYLQNSDIKNVEKEFDTIFITIDPAIKRIRVRLLIMELMARFFISQSPPISSEHLWLFNAIQEMQKKKNFSEGLPALLRITNYTHEHVCRCMKKMYNTTPINYINNLRLCYAENLLLHTELDVFTISSECGFSLPNYFYTLFKNRYGLPPISYRKLSNNSNKHCEISSKESIV